MHLKLGDRDSLPTGMRQKSLCDEGQNNTIKGETSLYRTILLFTCLQTKTGAFHIWIYYTEVNFHFTNAGTSYKLLDLLELTISYINHITALKVFQNALCMNGN